MFDNRINAKQQYFSSVVGKSGRPTRFLFASVFPHHLSFTCRRSEFPAWLRFSLPQRQDGAQASLSVGMPARALAIYSI